MSSLVRARRDVDSADAPALHGRRCDNEICLLPAPLRDRFGFTAHLEFYETDELQSVVTRSASLLGSPIDAQAAHEIASRSRGTPRIANRLLRRVVDYAQVHGDGQLTLEAARGALELFEVDLRALIASTEPSSTRSAVVLREAQLASRPCP